MTVLSIVKRTAGSGNRRRSAAEATRDPASRRAPATGDGRGASTQRRRVPPPTQDRALYTCSCGYVFSTEVSASVACPHCGATQAW